MIMTRKHKTLTYFGMTFLSLAQSDLPDCTALSVWTMQLNASTTVPLIKISICHRRKNEKTKHKSRRSETIVEKDWTLIRGKLWRDWGITWKPGFRDYLNAEFERCYASFKCRSSHWLAGTILTPSRFAGCLPICGSQPCKSDLRQ